MFGRKDISNGAVERARAYRELKMADAERELERAVKESAQGDGAAERPRIGNPRRRLELAHEMARLKAFRRKTMVRHAVCLASVLASAFLQAYTIHAFVNPAGLLSSGFTGLAILIDRVTSLFGMGFPTFLGMLALNIPVALICWKSISRRFVIFSMLQVFFASFFLRVLSFGPLLHETILEVVFGGFLYGLSIAIALRGGASTAGTDFISLMVSNKTGKSAWGFIFAGNCAVLGIFGMLFGWEATAYSIIFQFISTKTIETFYHRYDRVTLQITTKLPDEVLDAYHRAFRHGSSCVECIGGYSRERYWLINSVVSSYEVPDIASCIRLVDEAAVINVVRTEDFYGNFYRGEM